MVVTLEVITDVYSKPDSKGNTKIVKKNLKYKKQFDTQVILAENFTDNRGTIVNKYCIVKSGEDYFKLNHSFTEIEKLIQDPIEFNGFKIRNNKHKKDGQRRKNK